MTPRVMFVDVDDTLIRFVGLDRQPMPDVVRQIQQLYAPGVVLYLWSSAGAEYARSSAIELGLEHCFVAFLPKPDVYFDDQPVHDWKFCRHVFPADAADA